MYRSPLSYLLLMPAYRLLKIHKTYVLITFRLHLIPTVYRHLVLCHPAQEVDTHVDLVYTKQQCNRYYQAIHVMGSGDMTLSMEQTTAVRFLASL